VANRGCFVKSAKLLNVKIRVHLRPLDWLRQETALWITRYITGRGEVVEVRKKWQLKLLLAVALLWTASAIVGTAQGVGHVDIVQAEGPVTPAMLIYVERGIATAEEDGAVCLILQLDTPGGSVSLAKNIVQRIAEARVPVVVYVAPRGAWAASAGTLITLAGHVAAMAPETSIGAASPVGMQGEDLPETAQKKEKEILMASARSLAERRGEKAVAWVESAIEEAKAATAQEALDAGVIDFIAGDVGELLAQLDGFTVQVHGQETILHTAGVNVHPTAMNPLERLLHAITDPTIAFILMTLGINAINRIAVHRIGLRAVHHRHQSPYPRGAHGGRHHSVHLWRSAHLPINFRAHPLALDPLHRRMYRWLFRLRGGQGGSRPNLAGHHRRGGADRGHRRSTHCPEP